jgi:hypothetical protein
MLNNKKVFGEIMELEYEKGFVDALEVVLEIAEKHKENFVEKIGELWILALGHKVERIKKDIGFIDYGESK